MPEFGWGSAQRARLSVEGIWAKAFVGTAEEVHLRGDTGIRLKCHLQDCTRNICSSFISAFDARSAYLTARLINRKDLLERRNRWYCIYSGLRTTLNVFLLKERIEDLYIISHFIFENWKQAFLGGTFTTVLPGTSPLILFGNLATSII